MIYSNTVGIGFEPAGGAFLQGEFMDAFWGVVALFWFTRLISCCGGGGASFMGGLNPAYWAMLDGAAGGALNVLYS
jgi:hypothetical protein